MAPLPNLTTILIECLSESTALFYYNQPQISNAFTVRQYLELRDALVWARDEPAIKVVVVAGKGKHYCAGKAMAAPGKGDTIEQEVEAGGKLAEVLQTFPKILIAAVHGAAIGWGCTQLPYFDLIYAHTLAFFQTPFMALGFVPEGGSSYTFPALMGKQRANALLIAGDRLSVRDMYAAGLVTEVVEARDVEAFLEEVKKRACRIGGSSGESLRVAKELVGAAVEGERERLVRATRREGEALLVRLNSVEAKESMRAFAQRKERAKL
ncbi:ClpP/crotonase [Lepidopterella palustris CBS 459.81]|uniref:ClpP/crotonase n=1 Tax=Lepidopterella palustris CBS 459.81 TaxID=1314670 RepID=A0A8E2EI31_9PEZI|nr:ClpP/crotonase [Lepidopterella palustris CBS 459.81]